jgi:hypothetical protein
MKVPEEVREALEGYDYEVLMLEIDRLVKENYRLRRHHELAATFNHNYPEPGHKCCCCVKSLMTYHTKALEEKS